MPSRSICPAPLRVRVAQFLPVLTLSLGPLVCGATVAQEVSSSASQELEEVLVTARRRTENLQDIPDSITVIDGARIERLGIDRLNRAASLAPNLRFSDDQEVGASTITIRGVTQNRGTGEPPVAFVVDGVPFNNSLLSTQDLFDVQQIEVLRGPQGALYGRNSIGGAIVITSRQPTVVPEARVRLRAAEGDDYRFDGSISGPIGSEALLYRVSLMAQERDGQLKNKNLDNKLVDFKSAQGARGWLLWKPTERLDMDLRFQYSAQEGGSGYFRPWSESFLGNTVGDIQSEIIGKSYVDFGEGSLKVDYRFDAGTLTSITAYNQTRSGNDQDLDQTAQAFINILVDDDVDTFSQELRFVSEVNDKISWIAGGYFQDQTRDRVLQTLLNVRAFPPEPDFDPESAVYVEQPPAAQEATSEAWAVFGQLQYAFSEAWKLTLAGRYDSDKKADRTQGLDKTFSRFQPKVQLSWQPRDSLHLYGTVADGFRSGGFNNLAEGSQFGVGYDEEWLRSYELGMKSEFADGRARLDGAVFYIDYHDQQFFLFDSFGTQAFVNAPKSWIAGGELELSAQITDDFSLTSGFGFTDSEIVEFDDNPGLIVPPSEIIGKKVPGAPIYDFQLGLDWHHWLANGFQVGAGGEFHWRGRTYFTLDNIDTQEAYGLVDARVWVGKDQWRATVFGTNLFDEDYQEWFFASRFVGLPADISWPSAPRQIGLEFSYNF